MAIRPNEGRRYVRVTRSLDSRLLSVSPESTSPGSLSLKSTENALIDRLYADEFKRFIAGKIVRDRPAPSLTHSLKEQKVDWE